jgi:hypothetical protein
MTKKHLRLLKILILTIPQIKTPILFVKKK